jgi:hypothetical protein
MAVRPCDLEQQHPKRTWPQQPHVLVKALPAKPEVTNIEQWRDCWAEEKAGPRH